jgi:hypothetical protein
MEKVNLFPEFNTVDEVIENGDNGFSGGERMAYILGAMSMYNTMVNILQEEDYQKPIYKEEEFKD